MSRILNALRWFILVSMLLSACGSPTTATPEAPATIPVETQTAMMEQNRLNNSPTAMPKPGFETINDVNVTIPQGGGAPRAVFITSVYATQYSLSWSSPTPGINWVMSGDGNISLGDMTDAAIKVADDVAPGEYIMDGVLEDQNGTKTFFKVNIKVVSFCDFTIPAQGGEGGIPETYMSMTDGEMKDIMIGSSRIHAECISKRPVYTVAIPQTECLADKILYADDGGWACYFSDGMSVLLLGGKWIAPYGQPKGWNPPSPELNKLFNYIMPSDTPVPPNTQNG